MSATSSFAALPFRQRLDAGGQLALGGAAVIIDEGDRDLALAKRQKRYQ